MFLACVVLALSCQAKPPTIGQPPYLRQGLGDGATICVIPDRQAKMCSLVLAASSRGSEDDTDSHGFRHLLEHVVARGHAGDVDQRLEAVGGMLLASTYRDATVLEILIPPDHLSLALDIMADLLRSPRISDSVLSQEIASIREELALVDEPARLASLLWQICYGRSGLDPLGTAEQLERAAPQTLMEVFERQFHASNLVLTLYGPVELDRESSQLRALMSRIPGEPNRSEFQARKASGPVRAVSETFVGYGLPVGSFREPETAATLALCLGLARDLPGAFVVYTPSKRPGLITLGVPSADTGWKQRAARFSRSDLERLFLFARASCLSWAARETAAMGPARIQALLLAQGPDEDFAKFSKAVEDMSFDQFLEAYEALKVAISR